jgi:citrate synthase
MISGVLHGIVMLLFGHPIPALVFTAIFFCSGLIGAWAHLMKRRQRRSIVAEQRPMTDACSLPVVTGTQKTSGEQ